MNALSTLFIAHLKMRFREPAVVFFLYAFPLLLLLVFGLMFGHTTAQLGGASVGYVELHVPALAVLAMATIAFQQIPSSTAAQREVGILRTLRAHHLKPWVYIIAELAVNVVMVVLSTGLLLLASTLFFGLQFRGSALWVFACLVFCSVSLFSIGYLIACAVPSSRLAGAIGNLLFFPMMFLSGIAVPIHEMPEMVGMVGSWSPLGQAVTLMQSAWRGVEPSAVVPELSVLAVLLVVSALLAFRWFRWQ